MAENGSYDTLREALMEEDKDKRIQALRHLIEKGEDVNSYNSYGDTALILAASNGYDERVGVLLKAGADVNSSNKEGNMALLTAARDGHVKCVRLLLDAGTNVNQSAKSSNETALMEAAYNGHVKCVRVLLGTGANVNQSGVFGETALLQAAGGGYCFEHNVCVRVLLEAGADVHQTDKDGDTPIMRSTGNGCLKSARLLLGAGADVNKSDNHGFTPLMHAAGNGRVKCVQLLLKARADIKQTSNSGTTALIHAAGMNEIKCVRVLLKAGANVNDAEEGGRTALMAATRYGNDACARVSLEGGAEVVRFIRHRCDKCVRLLLEAGANVNDVNGCGNTVLIDCMHSYKYNNDTKPCLQLLINAGVDIEARNNQNLQPIHYALKLRPFFKFLADYLISENCTISQVTYDKIFATYDKYVDEEFLKEKDRLDVLKLLFACGLPCHLCQSYIVEQETSVRNWVDTVASQPRSLKSVCIFEIRRNLGLGIKSKVTKLNLPNVIQNMILLKGILSLDCFD